MRTFRPAPPAPSGPEFTSQAGLYAGGPGPRPQCQAPGWGCPRRVEPCSCAALQPSLQSGLGGPSPHHPLVLGASPIPSDSSPSLSSSSPQGRQEPPLCTLPSSRSASGHKHLQPALNSWQQTSRTLNCLQADVQTGTTVCKRSKGGRHRGDRGQPGQHDVRLP